MRATIQTDFSKFYKKLEAGVSKVHRATKKATKEACEEILENSLGQVPRQTETLALSAFYEIHGSYKDFSAIIGYGGNGDPVNPETGLHASEYMMAVHEDPEAFHPIGKWKYLEDPLNEYAEEFPRAVVKHFKEEFIDW